MKQQFFGLQLLRFFAAMMVVVMHTTETISLRMSSHAQDGHWGFGSAGVDIFFVISGFVMAISTPEYKSGGRYYFSSGWRFISRRVLRIAPLYWFYTVLKIVSVIAVPALALRTSLSSYHLVASFLFFPAMSPWGLVQPVLPVGWSLCFEMLFYAIFAIAIALNLSRLLFCLAVFAILYLAQKLVSDSVALTFYSQSIVFEFVLGLLVARFVSGYRKFNPALALLCVVTGGIMIFGIEWTNGEDRFLTWGVGAAFLVLGTALFEGADGFHKFALKLAVLGDMSYSTYLCHTFIVPACVVVFGLMKIYSTPTIVVITSLVVIVGSLFSYFYIEMPMGRFFKKFTSTRKSIS